jgi:hypothetical protein
LGLIHRTITSFHFNALKSSVSYSTQNKTHFYQHSLLPHWFTQNFAQFPIFATT